MASGLRTRRATSQPVADASALNNLERLLFAQAVHQLGSDAWPKICELLGQHPMIQKPKHFFTPQSCRVIFTQLLEEAVLECPEHAKPRSEVLLKLAQRHYVVRLAELKGLIAAEEAKFKMLVTEIDEIRGGLWDHKILGKPMLRSPGHVASPVVTEELQTQESQDMISPAPAVNDLPSPEKETEEPEPDATVVPDVSSGVPIEDIRREQAPTPDVPDIVVSAPPAARPDAREEEEEEEEEPVVDLTIDVAMEEEEEVEKSTEDVAEGPPLVEPVVEPEEAEKIEHPAAPSPSPAPLTSPRAQPEVPTADVVSTSKPVAEQEESPPADAVPSSEVLAPIEPQEQSAKDQAANDDVVMTEVITQPTSAAVVESSAPRIDNKRKAFEVEGVLSESLRDKKRAREESEPADEEEAGPSSGPKPRRGRPTAGEGGPVVSKRFQNVIGMLHSQISQHRFGNIFQYPIKKSEAPDYHDIVKRPMDLKTIKGRIKDGLISNSTEFQRDIFLMFANAMMYNRPGSEIYNMAEEMMSSSESQIATFRHTEGFHRM